MTVEPAPEAPDRQRRLEEVLAAYFEAEGRGAAPDRATLFFDHPDLAAELAEFFNDHVKLHQAAAELRTPLERHIGPDAAREDSSGVATGRFIGDYEILSTIARGGMGIVYQARQQSLNRRVALKMLRDGVGATSDDLRRFQREAEAIANLDHPQIVPVYEIGEHEGHRYFSMKLVEGGSLADRIGDYADDQSAAARVIAAVARAIHHAHERGILHRDLKPSNILIDERGEPLVVDFGLALHGDAQSVLTRTGLLPGTPAYMAPEQVDGRRDAVTPATDVHGLGTILYTMLTGRPPFKGVTPWASLSRVRDEAPERPSLIRRSIDRDLETVCLKCLEKEPGRRYATALALAEDLDRWLAGRPIRARRVGPVGGAWRLGRRHPWVAALGAAVFALTATTLTLMFVQHRDRDEVKRLDQQSQRLTQAARADQSARDLAQAWRAWSESQLAQARVLLDAQRPSNGYPDFRSFPWHYLDRLLQVGQPPLLGHRGAVYSGAFSPDGTILATAGEDGKIRLWDPKLGVLRSTLVVPSDGVNAAEFSPDGRLLASANENQTVMVWEVKSSKSIATLRGHPDEMVDVLFSPDGRLLLGCTRHGIVVKWEVATWQKLGDYKTSTTAEGAALSPDGTTLAVAARGVAISWPILGFAGKLFGAGDRDVRAVAFSPDGKYVAAGGPKNELRLWNPVDGSDAGNWILNDSALESVAISPDSLTVAAVGGRGTIHLCTKSTHGQEAIASGHGRTWSVDFSPDGRTLATTHADGAICLWDLARDCMHKSTTIATSSVEIFEFSPDGTELTAADIGGRVWIYDASSFSLKQELKIEPNTPIQNWALSRDSRWLAAQSVSGTASVWGLPDGRWIGDLQPAAVGKAFIAVTSNSRRDDRIKHGDSIVLLDAANGDSLPVIDDRGRVILFGLITGREVHAIPGMPTTRPIITDELMTAIRSRHADEITSDVVSLDGTRVATGGSGGTVIVWDVATRQPIADLFGLAIRVSSMAFTPDGRTLAVCQGRPEVSLWDIASKRRLISLNNQSGAVVQVRFSPDGLTLATCVVNPGGNTTEIGFWSAKRPE